MRTERKEKLKIGYRIFTMSFVKSINKGETAGLCHYPASSRVKYQGRIQITKGLDPAEKANTILHEILHAVCYTQGTDLGVKEEERIVNALANGLCAFIRDNPRFILRLFRLLWQK